MKILYDHQAFTASKYGGVARYFYDLIRTLKKEPNLDPTLALIFSNNEYLKDNSIGEFLAYKPILKEKLTHKVYSQLNRLNSAIQISKKQFDIFHPTFHNNYFLPFLGKKPFVLTYHDLVSEKFDQDYAELDGFSKEYKQNILKKASKIIAVSENTKQDLLEFYKIPEKKIHVIWHSTHFSTYLPPENFDINTPKNYLLYVGNRGFYKNFNAFVKDLSPLLKKYPDLHLLCAGSSSFDQTELNLLKELNIQHQVQHFPICSDDALYRLYQKAIAFIYPSLYEGFGIPILEAFACACPVILSNRSCFPEVAQKAALYFNPDDHEELNHQIEQVLLNASLRNKLIENGTDRLSHFSQEKTAFQTYQIYKSIIA